MRDNAETQQRYLAFIDLHVGLRKLVVSGKALAAGVSNRPAASALPLTNVATKRLAAIVSLVALLLVVASVSLVVRPRGADVAMPELVRLTQSTGSEFFGQAVPAVGGTLEYGREYALTSGMVELRFPNGAEVILESPSVIEIAARDRLVVKVGACSVHAPPGAEGFRVETPHAGVVDLRTRFSVNVNDVGETDVQVVEGAADVQSRNEPANSTPLRLSNGESRRFRDKAEGASQPLAFDAHRYRRDLPDRVVSYDARADQDSHVDELLSVTVQRGGRRFVYPVGDLIGVAVTHFRAETNVHNIAVSIHQTAERQGASRRSRTDEEPAASASRLTGMLARSSVLESDTLLNTGLINPGGSESSLTSDPDANTPGLAVRFRRPVVNGPGPDVVFFDLPSVVDPPDGDAFHVSPLRFAHGLWSHSVRKFDITMLSPEARSLVAFELRFFSQPPQTLNELLNNPTGQRRPPQRFRALAVGIDLSDLGYAEGAEVNGLFFQDALDDDHQFDPVFIAGLPVETTTEVAP